MNTWMRRLLDTAALLLMGLGTLWGFGLLGNPVEQTAGGALSADATLLAPATPAFSIWSVIYLGLFAYTVLQWLPSRATTTRMRRTGWLAAASMVLNALWLLVTQVGWMWVSVAVILALAATLGLLVRELRDNPVRSRADRVVVDGTFGLYLGWVCVATAANITAAAEASGLSFPPAVTEVVAVLVVVAVAGLAVWLSRVLGARWAVALAAAWGLGWIAIARTTDEPRSAATAVAAAVAAVVVLGAVPLLRRRHASRVTPTPEPATAR